MGLFSKILAKLGLGHKTEAAPRQPSPTPANGGGGVATAPARPAAIPVVDVVAQLEERAKASPRKLNWRTSIVDLLTLLDIDSSLQARKELAKELGCPPELIGGDYARMNIWLHRTVLARIAENGGNIPANLLD